jgi:hypothetical protein
MSEKRSSHSRPLQMITPVANVRLDAPECHYAEETRDRRYMVSEIENYWKRSGEKQALAFEPPSNWWTPLLSSAEEQEGV